MPGQKRYEHHLPPPGLHHLAAHDRVQGVVPALHQHVGLQGGDEFLGGVLVEADDGVDAAQAQEDQGAGQIVLEGAGGALEAGDAGVGVQAEDEEVAQGPGVLEVLDVAGVDEIEATIGKDKGSGPVGVGLEEGGGVGVVANRKKSWKGSQPLRNTSARSAARRSA